MLRSRGIANSAAGVAFLGEACVSEVCSSFAPLTRRLGGAKGVDDQPAGVVDPADRPIPLKSSTASSLTVARA